jgi:hypothetical protein
MIISTADAVDPLTPLLQYGVLGIVAVLMAMALKVMFTREAQRADRETARADRLEDELRKLNETVRTEYIGTLAKATEAISDALTAVRRS